MRLKGFMINRGAKSIYLSFLVVVLAILLIQYIINLNAHCIYIWDESIYANNALEMSVSKNVSFYTNNFERNYFNVKPPLVIFLEALSLLIFGYSEFALRIPTLLFFLGTLTLMIYYSKRLFGDFFYGIEASVLLLLCMGAIRPHVFLSADLDAGLVFFSLLLFLNHLEVCLQGKITNRNYVLYFVSILLGWFSKSTAIFLIFPALIALSIYYRNVLLFIKNFKTYITLTSIALLCGAYYLYKYKTDPLYVKLVWETEYLRLFKNIMPWHEQPFSFYFTNTIRYFAPVHWLAVAVTMIIMLIKKTVKKEQLALLLSISFYLITIAFPFVKLEWYDAVIYPVLALLISLNIHSIFGSANLYLRIVVNTILYASMFLMLAKNSKQFYSTLQSQEVEGDFLANTRLEYPSLKVLMKVEDDKTEHYNVVRYYLKRNHIYNKEYNQRITAGIKEIKTQDTVLCCSQMQVDSLRAAFKVDILQERKGCYVLAVHK